jgi:Fuc2NAc and GlcNAc transferase
VNLLDLPNARSSHEHPTPRGGGLSIVMVSLLAASGHHLLSGSAALVPPAALIGLAAVAAIGYLDDRGDVAARWRFIVHLVGAGLIMYSLGRLPPLPWLGGVIDVGLPGAAIAVLGLTWLINLYNFMDGIDGIAAVEAVTVLLGAIAILMSQGEVVPAEMPIMVAAVAGFLVWNWPPARIFMGDAASGFLGALLGFVALATSHGEGINLWSWLILLAVFIADATITLLRRIARGERWYSAHRSHAYQRLSRRVGHHWPVTVGVGAINILWLTPGAWIAAEMPAWGILAALVAYAPVVLVVWRVGAGLPDD